MDGASESCMPAGVRAVALRAQRKQLLAARELLLISASRGARRGERQKGERYQGDVRPVPLHHISPATPVAARFCTGRARAGQASGAPASVIRCINLRLPW